MDKPLKKLVLLLLAITTGAIGGLLFGFFIISFGDLIGRSGNTGQRFGVWNPTYALFIAKVYGSPLGAVVFPIGYFRYLEHTNFLYAIGLTSLGTLGGGLIGAVVGPPLAAIAGCVGFFMACHRVARPP